LYRALKRMTQAATDMASHPTSRCIIFGICALVFLASAATTVRWHGSMPGMDAMPMCDGGSMAMIWMRMPGQTWAGTAASFLGMWIVMMAAMMMPSLAPMLWRYRQAAADAKPMPSALAAVVASGYFFVWAALGLAIFPLGAALSAARIRLSLPESTVSFLVAIIVILAGALQFTAWKAHHLARCRRMPARGPIERADIGTAWRHGLRLGLHCVYSCGGLTAALLVIGVMDLRAMAAATVAVTAERLAPYGERVARVVGGIALGGGCLLIARAAGIAGL
jgi:predicted metal-binding membrane protein